MPSGASDTALLGVTASESQPPSHWPSQSEIADALDISRARVGQIVTADRTRWSKDPSITPFRHELCEQIQRLGGVVTIPEIIDLTILLRPAANTLETIRQQRMASAVARAAVETEASMAQPRFQIRRVGRQGRRFLHAGTGGVCRGSSGRWRTSWRLPTHCRRHCGCSRNSTRSASRNCPTAVSPSATSGS